MEPEPKGAETFLARAGAGADLWSFGSGSRLRVRLKQYIKIIIHIETDQANELSRYSFFINEKSTFFNLKAVQTCSYKAEVRARAGSETFWKSEPEQYFQLRNTDFLQEQK